MIFSQNRQKLILETHSVDRDVSRKRVCYSNPHHFISTNLYKCFFTLTNGVSTVAITGGNLVKTCYTIFFPWPRKRVSWTNSLTYPLTNSPRVSCSPSVFRTTSSYLLVKVLLNVSPFMRTIYLKIITSGSGNRHFDENRPTECG